MRRRLDILGVQIWHEWATLLTSLSLRQKRAFIVVLLFFWGCWKWKDFLCLVEGEEEEEEVEKEEVEKEEKMKEEEEKPLISTRTQKRKILWWAPFAFA